MAAKQRKEAPPVPPTPTQLANTIDLLEQSLTEIEVAAKELGEELSNVLLKEVELRVALGDENDNRSVVGQRLHLLNISARGITELLTDLRKALDPSIL